MGRNGREHGVRDHSVIVTGAGIGGLTAALLLATHGCAVTLVEKANAPGGKMREIEAGGCRVDAGPTVLTMRWIFEEIFAEAGASLAAVLSMRRAHVLARHAWSAAERLDLFDSLEESADAIGAFAGAREAAGYRSFSKRARKMFEVLDAPFIRSPRPRLDQLIASFGLFGLGNLRQISPFTTLWKALGEHFRDPRLLQLFGRYATYCGSSPFFAPATLMLVAHVEQDGVWLVDGGLHQLAKALETLCVQKGVIFRYGSGVSGVIVHQGEAAGVVIETGERFEADAVVMNADVQAVTAGLFGAGIEDCAPRVAPAQRSLSALTFVWHASTSGFPLDRHNVFFSRGYKAEFDAIFRSQRLPPDPTVYICAQDRGGAGTPEGPERLLCIVNAPASGDHAPPTAQEIATCQAQTFAQLKRCGLTIEPGVEVITGPSEFNRLFPGTGGALYGPASHGWQASFNRAGSRTSIPGLYLAGGSVHPGPGVPMAAMSGRLAAQAVLSDRDSISRSRATAMPGGISTP